MAFMLHLRRSTNSLLHQHHQHGGRFSRGLSPPPFRAEGEWRALALPPSWRSPSGSRSSSVKALWTSRASASLRGDSRLMQSLGYLPLHLRRADQTPPNRMLQSSRKANALWKSGANGRAGRQAPPPRFHQLRLRSLFARSQRRPETSETRRPTRPRYAVAGAGGAARTEAIANSPTASRRCCLAPARPNTRRSSAKTSATGSNVRTARAATSSTNSRRRPQRNCHCHCKRPRPTCGCRQLCSTRPFRRRRSRAAPPRRPLLRRSPRRHCRCLQRTSQTHRCRVLLPLPLLPPPASFSILPPLPPLLLTPPPLPSPLQTQTGLRWSPLPQPSPPPLPPDTGHWPPARHCRFYPRRSRLRCYRSLPLLPAPRHCQCLPRPLPLHQCRSCHPH